MANKPSGVACSTGGKLGGFRFAGMKNTNLRRVSLIKFTILYSYPPARNQSRG
jgi:hypothetical protein